MSWFNRIAERRMRLAEAKGDLKGLAGEGKPLPYRPGDTLIDAGEAVGFRIMAEAGVLPEEIILKKQVAAQKERLSKLTDPDGIKAAMAILADLEMRQAMAEEARRAFMRR